MTLQRVATRIVVGVAIGVILMLLRSSGAFAAAPPMVKATRSGTQAIASSTSWTAVALNAEEYDTDGFHDNTTDNSRVTIPTGLGGIYQLSANVEYENGLNGRALRFVKNGSTVVGTVHSRVFNDSPGIEHGESLTVPISLAAGDYVTMEVRQVSGSSVNINTLGVTHLAAVRLDHDAGGGSGAGALDDLTDVEITSPIDGAVIKYDEGDGLWKVATDDAGGSGSSGPVTLSDGDRDRLDLIWWGVWGAIGLALAGMIAPYFLQVFRTTHGLGRG